MHSRKIIHVDMDCFFAAIEARENPHLKGKPIAVGGVGARSVVATCSYEARKFGIHSAMPMSTAMRRCPALIVVPVNMPLYKSVSADIQALFHEYTSLVEPLSLDEAFLDVSCSTVCEGSATRMAKEICGRIKKKFNLTASAGVASNKFLAKVASDWNKPDGCFVVLPDEADDFIKALPVKHIFGVGKVTAKRLAELNIATCGELRKVSLQDLNQHFGRFGQTLYHVSRGIDERPVKTTHIRKSLSVEDTFAKDLPTLEACLLEISPLLDELEKRKRAASLQQKLMTKSLFLKMRFKDFSTTTVQLPCRSIDKSLYYHLCAKAWERSQQPVRLIGIGMSFFPPDYPEQLELF